MTQKSQVGKTVTFQHLYFIFQSQIIQNMVPIWKR